METNSVAREQEIQRYRQAYRRRDYAMGFKRQRDATQVLTRLEKGSLLDVGAGRGEGVRIALAEGHAPVHGVEPVDYLCDGATVVQGVATALPFDDKSFDTVMCLDVLEHLIEDDIVPALEEFQRVASHYVFLTASERPHMVEGLGDMHISKRPIKEWQAMFEQVFTYSDIEFLGKVGVSPGWLIRV